MANTNVLNVQNGKEVKRGAPPVAFQRNTATLGVSERRTGNNVDVILVDNSDSTEEQVANNDNRQKLDGIKESVTRFAMKIPASSHLSVISFASTVSILWPMQPVGQNKLNIIEAVQRLQPQGSTAMKEALIAARQEFSNAPQIMKRCFLLTDGVPDDDPLAEAEQLKQDGVLLYTIGFGTPLNMNEQLLRNMASLSDQGAPLYYYFSDPQQLTGFLERKSVTF